MLLDAFAHFWARLRLFVRKMVKRARRLVTGRCEVARICAAGPHTPAMSAALWAEWRSSDKLSSVLAAAQSAPPPSVDELVERIAAVKRVSPDTLPNLRRCVADAATLPLVARALRARMDTPYDSADAALEALLERLWRALLPGATRAGGRISRDWGRIGFQQSDPASDFRAAGALALDQLVHIAERRSETARRMIVEPAASEQRYPWACVGINLTREVVRVVENGWLDRALLGKPVEDALVVVNETYADMFETLHRAWVASNPSNLLDYPPVFKKVIAGIDDELRRTGTLVPPAPDGGGDGNGDAE